jgi:hypothetical protein
MNFSYEPGYHSYTNRLIHNKLQAFSIDDDVTSLTRHNKTRSHQSQLNHPSDQATIPVLPQTISLGTSMLIRKRGTFIRRLIANDVAFQDVAVPWLQPCRFPSLDVGLTAFCG